MSTTLKTAGWVFFIHRTGEIHATALQAAPPMHHSNRDKETKYPEILDHILITPLSLSVPVHTPTPPAEDIAVFPWARKPYTFHANSVFLTFLLWLFKIPLAFVIL